MKHIIVIAILGLWITGCASVEAPVHGTFWSDVKSSGGATEAYGGTARGEACAASYLGAVAMGDASIDAAKRNGGIAQVTAVDHSATNIFVFYAKYCTIVYGKKAAGGAAPAATPPAAKPAG